MTSIASRGLRTLAVVALAACAGRETPVAPAVPQYLYLWTASADSTRPDFLAVVDVTEDSVRYGRLVTTLPVSGLGNVPHHTEHEMPADGQLFANGFGSGETFVFDLSTPDQPRIAAQFRDVAGFSHPHSFLRLPGGNVLATFQMRHEGTVTRAGGLVELTPAGTLVRSAPADYPGADAGLRVYSAGVLPAIDRVLTTTTDMNGDSPASRNLQLWRLSDLSLLRTIALPDGPAGGEGLLTAEPRLLPDGKRLLVSTFNCGLYLVDGLDGDAPSARLVASFPRKEGAYCAIPLISGRYYLVTVPAWNAVVSLDISDPSAPVEVSRMVLATDEVPHWIALSPDHRRVVVTGYEGMQHRVVIAAFDSSTGRLAMDMRFREPGAAAPGFLMSGREWPHGGNAPGIPHGAVFSRPGAAGGRPGA